MMNSTTGSRGLRDFDDEIFSTLRGTCLNFLANSLDIDGVVKRFKLLSTMWT